MIKTIFPMVTENQHKLPFVVKGIGVQANQEHILRSNGFPHYHWAHCGDGEGKLIIGGNEYKITPGTGFFFRPGLPHEYYPIEEPWQIYWLIFDGAALPKLLSYMDFPEWGIMNIQNMAIINNSLKKIYMCLNSDNPDKHLKSSALLYEFLIELKNSTLWSGGVQNEKVLQLLPVISHMENNYDKYSSLEEMADIIGVTPYHLCRLFKQAFHLSPFKYLTRLRIQKAKELLVSSPDMSIKDIARSTGYSDPSYFCSVFKEHEKLTPLEFRKMHGFV
ncbi:MAG: AraC family transcriptional regulator [Caldicoprobacterales bacterium]|jgi:AraC family transcriptional regulator of arabinose operon